MLVISVVFVLYMSSQKGEFIFLGSAQLHACLIGVVLTRHFTGNVVYVYMMKETFIETLKVVDKPSKVPLVHICTRDAAIVVICCDIKLHNSLRCGRTAYWLLTRTLLL